MKNNMMDMYLENLENSYDAMGKIAMDNMAEVTITKKSGHKPTNRGERRRATKKAKERNKALYLRYGKPEIWSNKSFMNRDDSTGTLRYFMAKTSIVYIKKDEKFAGVKSWHKAQNRKIRHQKYETLPEEPIVVELIIDDEEDFVWQSLPIGEPIAPKVYDAWYWCKYDTTMEAWEELVNIKKSINKVWELNKILHSDKLADIIENLADNWSEKF